MKKINVWFIIALIVIGFSLGVIVGVKVDNSKVYNTTIERIKQKRGGRDIIIDVKPLEAEKTNKELRQEKRDSRREKRKNKRHES